MPEFNHKYELWYRDSYYPKIIKNGITHYQEPVKRTWVKPATFFQLQSGEGEIMDFSGELIFIRDIQFRDEINLSEQLTLNFE